MIKNVINLLMMDNHYGVSKNVDFAKGINSIPRSYRDILVLWKRQWKSKA
jgi:hypothetical protein